MRRPAPIAGRPGFALEATLLLLVLFGSLVGAAMAAVTTFTRTAAFDVRAARVNYAAEGGADQVMAQLDAAMQDGAISPGEITALQPPVMDGYVFQQQTSAVGTPDYRTITRGAYAGLFAVEQPMQVRVTANDPQGNQAAVELGVVAQSIPIFQFGVFFDRDLEILNGPLMTFVGWVHTNGALYLSSNASNYTSRVSSADSVFWQRKDRNERFGGVRIANQSGVLTTLDFDSRDPRAHGAAFVTMSNSRFGGRLQSRASGVRPLRLPLPTGMNPIELIRPAQPGDSPDVQQVRMANKADLRLVVDLAQDLSTPANFCANVQFFRGAGLVQLPNATCQAVFRFTPNRFWDGREMTSVEIIDLDVGALRTWVNGDPNARRVSIIYVEVRGIEPANAARNYPALRLHNGAQLPNPPTGSNGGLSVATNVPMYVRGNYNTINWRPAAIFADAVTYLSGNWDDGQQATFARRGAASMTVNVAMIAGNSETPADWMRVGAPQQYGGGLENFPRFLESWNTSTFTYTGSLVCLFPSTQSTGAWNHGLNGQAYYLAPNRAWAFDTRFRDPNNLPPGTPLLGSTLQISFRNIF